MAENILEAFSKSYHVFPTMAVDALFQIAANVTHTFAL